jgi:hypothetical protein
MEELLKKVTMILETYFGFRYPMSRQLHYSEVAFSNGSFNVVKSNTYWSFLVFSHDDNYHYCHDNICERK